MHKTITEVEKEISYQKEKARHYMNDRKKSDEERKRWTNRYIIAILAEDYLNKYATSWDVVAETLI